MGTRLEAKVTAVGFLEVARALEAAWSKLLGTAPTREALAVLLAQSALETGHWKKSYCFNLGNQKATSKWEGDYCFYPADEIVTQAQAALAFAERAPRTDGVPGHNVELTPIKNGMVQVTLHADHPWCRFRAYTSLNAGAEDYLALLNKRFKGAWPAIEAGDPERFVRTLRELRYFTASIERYLPPVLQLFGKFSKALTDAEKAGAPPTLPVSPAESLPLPVSATGRPTLRRGDKGALVSEVQRILNQMGYADVPSNGTFDEATLKAVELFQLQHVDERGLPLGADGVIGKNTWWALLNPSGDAQTSGLATPKVAGLTPTRTKLLQILDAEHARPVFEKPDGSNRSPDIDRYFGKTGVHGAPWCCAFVSWALHEALAKLPVGGKHHLGVQMMWVAAKELGFETREPKPGDVFIQIKSGGTGHTGFVVGLSTDGNTVFTCEGNCGNRLKYGQRPRTSIHHFVDCIRDGQANDFPRGANVNFDDVATDGTR
jgi:peptidoglycan hydrolase-like protein with peptidoglycan-binding domain